jgi:hypothetical protein
MDKNREESLRELFRRAGLELSEQDRERFLPMLEAYLDGAQRIHAINLSGEETAPVFRPETNEER